MVVARREPHDASQPSGHRGLSCGVVACGAARGCASSTVSPATGSSARQLAVQLAAPAPPSTAVQKCIAQSQPPACASRADAPQQTTLESLFRAQVCRLPVATWTTLVRPYGGSLWRAVLSPLQQKHRGAGRSWSAPRPAGGVGTGSTLQPCRACNDAPANNVARDAAAVHQCADVKVASCNLDCVPQPGWHCALAGGVVALLSGAQQDRVRVSSSRSRRGGSSTGERQW